MLRPRPAIPRSPKDGRSMASPLHTRVVVSSIRVPGTLCLDGCPQYTNNCRGAAARRRRAAVPHVPGGRAGVLPRPGGAVDAAPDLAQPVPQLPAGPRAAAPRRAAEPAEQQPHTRLREPLTHAGAPGDRAGVL